MLPRNRSIFLSLSYRRLFSDFSLKVSSMSSHTNNRRHRTSTSAAPRTNVNKNLNQTDTLRRLFQPIDVKPMMATSKSNGNSAKDFDDDVGQELTGGKTLDRSAKKREKEKNEFFILMIVDALLRIITDFYRRDEVKKLAADQGLDLRLFQDAYVSFRKFCIQSTVLPVDLHIILSDIISGSGRRNSIRTNFINEMRFVSVRFRSCN